MVRRVLAGLVIGMAVKARTVESRCGMVKLGGLGVARPAEVWSGWAWQVMAVVAWICWEGYGAARVV
jgi:hypothetical protein